MKATSLKFDLTKELHQLLPFITIKFRHKNMKQVSDAGIILDAQIILVARQFETRRGLRGVGIYIELFGKLLL